jgi:hypothetical protein
MNDPQGRPPAVTSSSVDILLTAPACSQMTVSALALRPTRPGVLPSSPRSFYIIWLGVGTRTTHHICSGETN